MENLETQRRFFTAITNDRAETATVLEKSSVEAFKNAVVDKYSDQAHFIYELIQNADDVKATNAHFYLKKDGLIFVHNGLKLFSASNPNTEREDRKQMKLGDINAITSIGQSSKDNTTIGKFGVGFKAIFQYSNTPYIYDNNFWFYIERFIVPKELKEDHSFRKKNETLFYFPFDKEEISNEDAFDDILQKLKTLVHPVLFLNNLNEVQWETDNEEGIYTKTIETIPVERDCNGVLTQFVSLIEKNDNCNNEKKLWLFTRAINQHDIIYKYSVGFFLDKKMKLSIAENYTAFCFFPTKETTNLKFIIQAPFLLTDSREGIKAGIEWNKILIENLSYLAADSLLILKEIGINDGTFIIDDSIINIIPYKSSDFTYLNDRNKISLLPFYSSILKKLQTEELLPCKNGKYASRTNSHWASDSKLLETFSDEQIAFLLDKPDSKWVFTSIGRSNLASSNKELVDYIDGGNEILKIPSKLINSNLDPDKILIKITGKFIENQPKDWLNGFYAYLFPNKSYQEKVKRIPIFINNENKAQAAYNYNNELILFLPTDTETEYQTIHNYFLHFQKTIDFFRNFGIKEPSLKDEIYNKILSKFMSKTERNSGMTFYCPENSKRKIYFKKIFEYYEQFKQNEYWELHEYLNKLKNILFIDCLQKSKPNTNIISTPEECYYPDGSLVIYFEENANTVFINLEFYKDVIDGNKNEVFIKFLEGVGVNFYPKIVPIPENIPFDKWVSRGIKTLYKKGDQFLDKKMDCIELFINNINPNKSIVFWNILVSIIKRHNFYSFESKIQGEHKYSFYGTKSEEYNSTIFIKLIESKWLFNRQNMSVTPNEVLIKDLSDNYDIDSSESKALIKFLGIKYELVELNPLTDEQKQAQNYWKRIKEAGIPPNELDDFIAAKKSALSQSKTDGSINENKSSNENADKSSQNEISSKIQPNKRESNEIPKPFIHNKPIAEDETEEDELVPIMIEPKDIRNKFEEIEKKKDREYLDEKELRKRRTEYLEIVQNSEMYSFGWFNALLELEDSFTAEDRVKRNPIRVVFNKATIDEDGTLLLTETPSIPPTIQDIGDIQISFYSGTDNEVVKRILAEVVSPLKDKIKVKLKNPDVFVDFDFSIISKAVVEISNADFILNKLKNAFKCLEFQDKDNLLNLLPQSLSFVFGPPGTGKTTYLAWLIGGLNPKPLMLAGTTVTPLMDIKNKVLVLTPTNKAADVLVEKIIENYDSIEQYNYQDWLLRFGETQSEKIERSTLFIKDRKVPPSIDSKCTIVTTIARFPYDKFKIERKNKKDDTWEIKNFDWDYIIFDEASMISLASIVYVIYQASKINPNVKFIIGGDPYQIHPIIQFNWEGWSYVMEPAINFDGTPKLDKEGKQEVYPQDAGNIYSVVGLINDKSFINPQTVPHQFPVHNLTKQYRSIEPIGALFSHYRYHGKLKHDRKDEEMLKPEKAIKEIKINNLPLNPITIIHFNVKKYPPVYRPRSVKGSPYQVYSAVFAVEILKYIQQNATIDTNSNYKIGVICPYKIQESIINKLVANSCKGNIEIITGTVHGFQGDQCDMIIVVLNPPCKITRSTRSFLNKKNILNVAISRAKDCLMILVPENKEGDINVEDLHQIERIKNLARKLPETENHLIEYRADELEKTIFKGLDIKIEDFAVVSNHQNVNLYADSKIKYEIRIDENAIDIRI